MLEGQHKSGELSLAFELHCHPISGVDSSSSSSIMATYARDPASVQPTSAVDDIPPPKRTLEECIAIMTAPGAMHEYEEKTIEGRTIKVFKHAPPSLRDFWLAMATAWADREYVILGKERLTYKQVCRMKRYFVACSTRLTHIGRFTKEPVAWQIYSRKNIDAKRAIRLLYACAIALTGLS